MFKMSSSDIVDVSSEDEQPKMSTIINRIAKVIRRPPIPQEFEASTPPDDWFDNDDPPMQCQKRPVAYTATPTPCNQQA